MSLKLLKQSIDLVEEDLIETKSKKGKQTLNVTHKRHKTLNNAIAEDNLPQKTKRRLKDIKDELNSSQQKVDENMKRLLALSMNTLQLKDAKKIVKRAHKGRYVEKVLPPVQQESIFTEEDFRKFEEEYFN